jgi:putative ABC transport system substrate-binding protein
VRRRAFIAALGGAAAWPLAARAQQADRVRRIGVLMHVTERDQDGQARLTAFVEKLKELGWAEGRNLHFDVRWGPDDPNRYPRQAAELVAMAPDVLVAPTSFTVAALQRATQSVPIVFMGVIDPVGADFVSSLAKPGGNTTGFIAFEYTIGGKWLELLKEIAPHVTRAAVLRDASNASGVGQFAAIQAAGIAGIDLSVIALKDAERLERAIAAFASGPNGGLVVTASPFGVKRCCATKKIRIERLVGCEADRLCNAQRSEARRDTRAPAIAGVLALQNALLPHPIIG